MLPERQIVQEAVLSSIVSACTETLPHTVGFSVEGSLQISLTTNEIVIIDVAEAGEGKCTKETKLEPEPGGSEQICTTPAPQKRKRGRPRKCTAVPEDLQLVNAVVTPQTEKRKRGRPRKLQQYELEPLINDEEQLTETETSLIKTEIETFANDILILSDHSNEMSADAKEKTLRLGRPEVSSGVEENCVNTSGEGQLKMEHFESDMVDLSSNLLERGNISKNEPEDKDEQEKDNAEDCENDMEEKVYIVPEVLEQKLTKKKQKLGRNGQRINKFNCHICQKTFYKFTRLESHVNNHLKLKPYKCRHCPSSFSSGGTRRNHERIHTGERIFKCQECNYVCLTQIALRTHEMGVHTGERPFKCDQCDKRFSSKFAIQVHSVTHSDDRPFVCETCGKAFKLATILKAHCKQLHEPKEQSDISQCDICQRTFHNQNYLKIHMRQHTGEKPHQCSVCGHSFAHSSTLLAHEKRHTGIKPFKCESCDKTFTYKSQLKDHEKSHTGEKSFICQYCGKGFYTKYLLTLHTRTHTGEKPFKCDICEKRFAVHESLKAHKRIHTGDRPFHCDRCKKSFKQRSQLRRHLFTIHRIGKFCKSYYNNPGKHEPKANENLTVKELDELLLKEPSQIVKSDADKKQVDIELEEEQPDLLEFTSQSQMLGEEQQQLQNQESLVQFINPMEASDLEALERESELQLLNEPPEEQLVEPDGQHIQVVATDAAELALQLYRMGVVIELPQ